MASKKPESKTATRTRTDGRRPLLVYLDQHVIKQLKKVALDEDRTAYEITEEAVREWLATHKSSRGRQDE
jgi:hypothetical protein